MTETDAAILEFFYELGDLDGEHVVLPPKAVHENLVEQMNILQKSESTISRRMSRLSEEGFLIKLDDARGTYYKISETGISYLEGNLDAEELTNE